jgi:outer membrane protein TolC
MLPSASTSAGYGISKNHYDYNAYPLKNADGSPQLDENGVPKINPASTSDAVVQDLSYNGGISQPVYHWGALKKGYQSAQLQRAISSRNVGEIRRALAIDIRRAYFSLISTANGLESEKATLVNLETEKTFLKQQAADGFVTQSVADYTDTRIKDFKLQMQRSQNSFNSQWLAYCDLTGSDRASPVPTFPKEIPAVGKDLTLILEGLSPQPNSYVPASLLNVDDSIHVERLNYEIASTRLRPHFGVSLNANRGYHSPDTAVGFGGPYVVTSFSANATVNWSIFDGFSTQAAKQSSLIRQRQLKNSRDQAERDYRETMKSLVINLRLNWESLKRTEEGLSSARSSVSTYQKDYEAGFAPKQAWEAAKAGAESTQQAVNNARADYYIQIVNYLSLRGKDPAVNLTAKKQTFDAAKN